MAILMRRGLHDDFDPTKMLPGEWAVSIDKDTKKQIIWMCFAPGVVKRMGTYEDFYQQIQEATDDIREQYIAVFNEIKEYMEELAETTNGYMNTSLTKAAEAASSAENSKISAKESADSALKAGNSAAGAKNSAKESEDYSLMSKSYAVGTNGEIRDGDDTDNAQYYYEQAKYISQGGNGLIPMGTIAFEKLPTSGIISNAMYNISNNFTSDSRFADGGGKFYGAGSNVYYTVNGLWDVLAASAVTGAKGNAETTYRQGNVNLSAENIGATPMIRSSQVRMAPSTTGAWYRLGQANNRSEFFGIFTVSHLWGYNRPIVSRFIVGASCGEQILRTANIKEIFYTSKNGTIENKIIKKARVIYIPIGTTGGNIYVDVFLQGSENINPWYYTLESTYNWEDGKFAENAEIPTDKVLGYSYVANEFSFVDGERADTAGRADTADTADKLKTARSIDGISFDGSADITHFGVCTTAAATAAKTVSIPNFVLKEGAKIYVYFSLGNTVANPTLNVNSTGAKSIGTYTSTSTVVGAVDISCGIYEFIYYSNAWHTISNNVSHDVVYFISNDVSDSSATSWNTVTALTSRLTLNTVLTRISTMFKNVRYLYKMLGTTDISLIGGGTVTGAINSLNKSMDYVNISSKIASNSSFYSMSAYVEGGMVCINIYLKAGSSGVITTQINDSTYVPRDTVNGIYASPSSSVDKDKFVFANIGITGTITIWFSSALSYQESVFFLYPLKRS